MRLFAIAFLLVGATAVAGPLPLDVAYRGPSHVPAGTPAELALTITNRGSAPAELNLFVLAIPQLALEVRDAGGQIMPPISPPVPPDHMATAPLAPGAARTFKLTLDEFSPPLPRGHYTVRLRDDRARGTPFALSID